MFRSRVSSWNLRDCHMAETLATLATYLQGQEQPAKIVVWAHNSHLGDARVTEMGQAGEWSRWNGQRPGREVRCPRPFLQDYDVEGGYGT
jgi:erythromycin esterase-like protein